MMSFARALVGVLFLASLVAAQDTPESMLKVARKQEARSVGKKGEERAAELRRALEMFQTVPDRWPEARHEVATARLRSAEIQKRLGEGGKALATLAALVQSEGEATLRAKGLLLEASIRRRQKDFDGAEDALQRVVDDFGGEVRLVAEASLSLASLARKRKRWKTASDWAQRVLDSHPTLWRENVDAANVVCNVLATCRQWPQATAKLAELDALMEERFGQSDSWPSVRKALDKMSARRLLTPIPVSDEA